MARPAFGNVGSSRDVAFDRPHPRPDGRSAARTGGDRLWLIQVLRAIAALLVVIGHSQSAAGRMAVQQGRHFERCQILPWGAGVDLFFVISGFIMVYASRNLFAKPGGRSDFLSRRFSRVVPLYWCCTSAILAIVGLSTLKGGDAMFNGAEIIGSYLFIPVLSSRGGIFPVLDLGWTLNYEIAFYLLFAMFIGLERPKAVRGVIIAIAAAALGGTLFDFGTAPLLFWTRPIIIDFGLGVLIGSLCCEGVSMSRGARFVLVTAGTLLFAADPLSVFHGVPGATAGTGWSRVLATGLPAAMIVAGAVLGTQPSLPATMRPLVQLGNASYSLYLVHPFALILTEKLVQKFALFRGLPLPLLVVAIVLTSLVAALLSARFVEQPLSAVVDRWLQNGRDSWRRNWLR